MDTAYTAYEDTELFRLIAEGDETAFRQLFERYTPRIRPLIRSIIGEEAAVKDLIQDIFLLLWISREKLPDVQHPEKWIFRMVHYRCYKWLRDQGVRSSAKLKLNDTQIAGTANSTLENTQFLETSRLIRQAVQALPAQARKVYQLRREADMKIDEIADLMGLSPKTVKNTLTRALKSIQSYLEDNGIIIPAALLALLLS